MSLQRGWGLATLAVLLLSVNSANADFIIDSFGTTQTQTATGAPSGPKQDKGAVVAPGVFGGDRKVLADRTSNNGTVAVDINNNDPGFLDYSTTGSSATGTGTVIYDQSTNFFGPGSKGVNLAGTKFDVTEGGLDTGLNFNASADKAGATVLATFWNAAPGGGSSTSALISLTPYVGDTPTFFSYFTLFTAFSNPSFDFTKVVAVSIQIQTTTANSNISLDNVLTTATPLAPPVVPEPASFALVGLGMITSGFVALRRRKMAK